MRRRLILTLVISVAAVSNADASTKFLFAQPNASAPAQIEFRNPFSKPTHDELVKRQHDETAILKFAEGTAIRLRAGKFVVLDALLDMDRAARQGVTLSNMDTQFTQIAGLLERKGAALRRLLPSTTEETLREQHRTGEARIKKELPDLNLFFQIDFRGRPPSEIADLLNELNLLDIVEYAAPPAKVASPPVDIPPTTPQLSGNQTYFAPGPNGIDVNYARQLPGGRGESLRVVDVESGWIADHEDFPPLVSSSGNNYAPYRDHGAATIGEIAAVENGYGMTGIAPAVELSVASPIVPPDDAYNLPDGIQRAINQSRVGDIILIEQQLYYNWPSDTSNCPPEWDLGAYSVVENGVANGRVVILTAGNGAQNLDDRARFGDRFIRNVMDSGSIYVGSALPTTHVPRFDTNHGSRIDLHAWGEGIATLGYGTEPCQPPCLFFPNGDTRQAYTSGFSGTSGATPIVTGAAALIQTIRRARGLPDLSSQQMRTHLQTGATPQGAGVLIGPQPDLRDAIIAIPLPPPTNLEATGGASSTILTWTAASGVAGYEIFRKDSHGATWNLVSSAVGTQFTDATVSGGRTYLYRVRAYDAAGNPSADSNNDLATTINYTDPQLSTSTVIRAKHIIETRTAANAMCTYAGTSICSASPFTGSALDEATVQTQVITAADFTAVQNQIASLRAAIGATAATFRETPALGMTVKGIHMEDLRKGAN